MSHAFFRIVGILIFLALGFHAATAAEPRETELPYSYFFESAELQARYKLNDQALALYKVAFDKTKDDAAQARCLMGMAFVLDEQGKHAEAAELWRGLLNSSDPVTSGRARLILGQHCSDAKQFDAAIALWEDAALHDKLLIFRQTAAAKLSALMVEQKRGAEKLKTYQERLAKNPSDAALLDMVLGLQKDDATGRADTLALVAKSAPLDSMHAELLGSALFDAGRLDEAAWHYCELAKDPLQASWARERLAAIAMQRGKPDEAEKLIVENGEREPRDVRSELELCRKLLELGLLSGAEKHGRAAYALADERTMKGAVAMELGDALFRQAKFEEARALLAPLAEQNAWPGLKARAQALCAKMPAAEKAPNF